VRGQRDQARQRKQKGGEKRHERHVSQCACVHPAQKVGTARQPMSALAYNGDPLFVTRSFPPCL